ncbi:hypothetical protein P0W64_14070 [Tsukamurella sp. 8F]|uniref:hypothetical protein n=1 Tax=unclassified Tsukamurella TaxID=2633480 RepID=UPI0023B9A2AF|nr:MULTISPECIES: hypothetical protein [unclassified Tsukamurella]MDF0530700.1 hypothetical protein [Tsukamurella sp. 8J]MDF0587901.1 hypothetical protein [Tsukamurella sp. 8F]
MKTSATDDSTETMADETDDAEQDIETPTKVDTSPGEAAQERRRIREERAAKQSSTITLSVSRTTAVLGALTVLFAIAAIVFAGLWLSDRSEANDAKAQLSAQQATADQNQRAQDVATKYAVGAATVDYQNLGVWEKAVVAGTTPALSNTLQQAASQMEQIYSPVQWRSTATPITAVATSNKNGVIAVNVFVSVITKTTQTPEGMPSTATYSVTVDSRQNWVITDVRGIDATLPK